MIAQQAAITGSGKSATGWFKVDQASVSYDHPFDMPLEYTLNIDFTSQKAGAGAQWLLSWMQPPARALVEVIQEVMSKAVAGAS
jgi:hypothetical protein